MSVEFIDTNDLIYALERGAGRKHEQAAGLLPRLFEDANGAQSIQVLAESCAAAAKKYAAKGLAGWTIPRPAHADVLKAWNLHCRYGTVNIQASFR
jgi:predicted nucleic acid-binding protein